eukprot:340160-Prorocentrum_lima.AAC.1
MTSSLVGSEMCIRDSGRSERLVGSRDRLMAVDGQIGRSARLAGRSDRPVSYTHLTLPTICSV